MAGVRSYFFATLASWLTLRTCACALVISPSRTYQAPLLVGGIVIHYEDLDDHHVAAGARAASTNAAWSLTPIALALCSSSARGESTWTRDMVSLQILPEAGNVGGPEGAPDAAA